MDAALLVLLVGVLVLLDAGLDAAPSASCVQRKRASHRRYRLMGFYRVDAAFGELRPAKVGLHPARFGTVVDFGRSSTPTIQARQKRDLDLDALIVVYAQYSPPPYAPTLASRGRAASKSFYCPESLASNARFRWT